VDMLLKRMSSLFRMKMRNVVKRDRGADVVGLLQNESGDRDSESRRKSERRARRGSDDEDVNAILHRQRSVTITNKALCPMT